MIKDYTHELQKEVRSISGGYTLEREDTITVDGKTVLYVVGNALADSSCCGFWGCYYALVPGYVVNWKHTTNEEGIPISTVEAIAHEEVKRQITKLLEEKEGVSQVRFW
ncbi:MAG: hypothetical protein JSV55_05535 [Deltaproteobacteria bacterium]|nr:MAG: hypothetical protein JSV55_05535 [Deltaproteobacteria bacterium]